MKAKLKTELKKAEKIHMIGYCILCAWFFGCGIACAIYAIENYLFENERKAAMFFIVLAVFFALSCIVFFLKMVLPLLKDAKLEDAERYEIMKVLVIKTKYKSAKAGGYDKEMETINIDTGEKVVFETFHMKENAAYYVMRAKWSKLSVYEYIGIAYMTPEGKAYIETDKGIKWIE